MKTNAETVRMALDVPVDHVGLVFAASIDAQDAAQFQADTNLPEYGDPGLVDEAVDDARELFSVGLLTLLIDHEIFSDGLAQLLSRPQCVPVASKWIVEMATVICAVGATAADPETDDEGKARALAALVVLEQLGGAAHHIHCLLNEGKSPDDIIMESGFVVQTLGKIFRGEAL